MLSLSLRFIVGSCGKALRKALSAGKREKGGGDPNPLLKPKTVCVNFASEKSSSDIFSTASS
jgi:hypothetical protein